MSDEVTVRSSLQIINGNLEYRSYPTDFTTDATGAKGPTPGAIEVGTTQTAIDLTELSTPGWCRVINLDDSNYVSLGLYISSVFYPFAEVGPGEFFVFKLSRSIGSTLYAKADTAACDLVVEAFEA